MIPALQEVKGGGGIMEEGTAWEQQKQDHFARLLMAEAVRQLK